LFKHDESKKRLLSISRDVEDQLDRLLSAKRDEIGKILEEKVRFIKEEADRKYEQVKEAIAQEKKEVKHYVSVVAELENTGDEVRNQINQHIAQAARHKKEIWRLTELHNADLTSTLNLSQKLDKLQQEANERAKILRNQLEVKYGIRTKLPEIDVLQNRINIDVDKEKERLARIRELLLPLDGLKPPEIAPEAEKEAAFQLSEKTDLASILSG